MESFESPSCFNDFWSILGCEDDKVKQQYPQRNGKIARLALGLGIDSGTWFRDRL